MATKKKAAKKKVETILTLYCPHVEVAVKEISKIEFDLLRKEGIDDSELDVLQESLLDSTVFGSSIADEDIHIKVAVDPTILDDYNTENGTTIPALDADKYTVVTDAVIPAGQQYAPVKITIPSTMGISADNSYAIGLKIISADAGYVIASNMNKTLVEIVIKNQYDGDYISNGYFYHPSAPRGITDRPKTLATVNATSVWTELGDLGGSGYFAIFDVDPATNKITIRQNPGSVAVVDFGTGLPSTNPGYTAQWANSAECNNVYDPATESFKVRYGYVGGTGYRVTEEIIVKE